MLGGSGEDPVLYVSIGHNGAVNCWQWASLDPTTREPMTKAEAIMRFWRLIDLVLLTTESAVTPELLLAAGEPVSSGRPR